MGFIPAAVAAVGKAVSGLGLGGALTAGSAAVSGLTAIQQGRYQSAIAETNQKIAADNAMESVLAGRAEAAEQDAMTLGAIGQQLAVQSASGLSTGSRSSVMTRKSTRELGRKDALNVNYAGQLQARNFRTQAANFGAEAKSAGLSGLGAAVGTLGKVGSLVADARTVRQPNKFTPRPYGRPASIVY